MTDKKIYITHFGIRMVVKRRFEFKGEKKIELFNPKNNNQFIINENELSKNESDKNRP